MAIEILEGREIKLKDVVMEEGKQEAVFFDPERDLSEGQWSSLFEYVASKLDGREAPTYIDPFYNFKILSPSRAKGIPVSEEELGLGVNYLRGRREEKGLYWYFEYFRLAAQLQVCFEKRDKVWNDATVWRRLKKETGELSKEGDYINVFEMVFCGLVLFPKKEAEVRSWLELVREKHHEYYDEAREAARIDEDWSDFIEHAFWGKILLPEEYKLSELTQDDWKSMIKGVTEQQRPSDLYLEATRLFVLSAGETRIDAKGLHTFPKKETVFGKKVPEPEEREF